VEMRLQLLDQCSKSVIPYGCPVFPVMLKGGRLMAFGCLDGEWDCEKLGGHATSMELHILRQHEDRSDRAEDSPD
jgi:hypothetical protein